MSAFRELIDSTIGLFSPEAQLRRMRARNAIDFVRGYKGAMDSRSRGTAWGAASTSGTAEAIPSLSRLRNSSRQLMRDDPIARKAMKSIVTALVGTGVKPRMKDPTVFERWCEYADADGVLDFAGLQALAVNSWLEGGNTLIRRRIRRPQDGFEVPLQLQILEGDYLDMTKTNNGANIVVGGVEFDALGKRVAYWLFPEHPGDVTVYAKSLVSRRIPAEEIIHLFAPERPGQVVGVPVLSSSIAAFRDANELREIDMMFRKVAACFSVFVTSDDDQAVGAPTGKKDAKTSMAEEVLAPGMIKYLKPGQSVQTAAPPVSGGIGEVLTLTYQLAAAGMHVSYERATGDMSKVNYSSIRAGELNFQAAIDQLQWLIFVPVFMKGVMRWFDQIGALAGVKVDARKVIDYTTPRMGYVDPEKEVAAIKEEIRGGLKSHSGALRERGEDPDKIFGELAEDRKKLKALGVTVDTDPANEMILAQAKAEQAKANGPKKSASDSNAKS